MLGEKPILPFSAQSNVVYPDMRQFDLDTYTVAGLRTGFDELCSDDRQIVSQIS